MQPNLNKETDGGSTKKAFGAFKQQRLGKELNKENHGSFSSEEKKKKKSNKKGRNLP